MVGLKPRGEAAGQAEGVRKRGDHAALARDGDQILVAHELLTAAAISGVRPGASRRGARRRLRRQAASRGTRRP